MTRSDLLRALYDAFNRRAIDEVLVAMTPDVDWPNGWEGGRVSGRDAVRDYWTRQWAEVDPSVQPVDITEHADGTAEVQVHQVVRDKQGALLDEGTVRHVYEFSDDLISRMTIEK